MNIFLNGDNDITMVDGGLLLVTGAEEIRQLVGQTLRSFEADWFLNLELGLPYFQTMLQKVTTLSEIEGIYLDAISGIRGILDIETFSLSFNKENRRADISFRALTTNGILDFTFNNEGT